MKKKLLVKGTEVTSSLDNESEVISLKDMLKAEDGDFFILDWLENRNAVEFLGIWESVNNPAFNYGEFAIIRCQAGLNQAERLTQLNQIAITKMTSLVNNVNLKKLN